MAEEAKGPETGAEEPASGADPAAVALALGGASRAQADAFLKKQGRLVDLQSEYLADKDRYELSHLRWRRFTEQMKGALQIMTAVVGIAVALGVSYMVWDAAHSNGLIIESFSVPSDLSARGLGGETFSNLLLDKLSLLQDQTQSTRPAQTYANNWGDDLKVEIPETGVSLGEVRRYLREWLGHDTHITGEVWQVPNGLAIVARATGSEGDIVTGPEADFDSLMQKVAENIYRVTQPYRYANYLDRDLFHPGMTDYVTAEHIYRRLVNDRSPLEQAYAWNGLANLSWTVKKDDEGAIAYYRKANEADPAFTSGLFGIAYLEILHLSRPEDGLGMAREFARIATGNTKNQWLDISLGDYADALTIVKREIQQAGVGTLARNQTTDMLLLGLMHDGPGLRDGLRDMSVQSQVQIRTNNVPPVVWMRLLTDAALEDWRRVLIFEPAAEKEFLDYRPGWDAETLFSRSLRPRLALAKAKLGDFSGAEVLIAPSPADCYDCLRFRGQIAAEQKQWARADFWFARAVVQGPSIPFADADWGQVLLARGQPDAAIDKFKLANEKGPHFADPLEGWGEALMAKNQSHLALAKFAEAYRYAPNWGRLHLKWGEALAYTGKPADAKAQFARAASLDLTPSEKSELARVSHG